MRESHTSKRIVLVEETPGSQLELAEVLSAELDRVIVDRTSSPREAILETLRLRPELVLVDLSDHGGKRLALLRKIRSIHSTAKVIAVSPHCHPTYANQALRCGADAYVVQRPDDPGEIIDASRDVLAGHLYVSDAVI